MSTDKYLRYIIMIIEMSENVRFAGRMSGSVEGFVAIGKRTYKGF
jgi:hypothetical protein